MKYLLRVEGVNLANVIDDTDQISVRRGGGLMILNAAAELKESLDPSIRYRLTEIATGASIGLFEFTTTDPKVVDAVRTAVDNQVRNGSLSYTRVDGTAGELALRHGTFVVDVVPVESEADVQQSEQLAVASNRWQQLQQPTLSIEGLWDAGTEPCYLDRTRAGKVKRDLNENEKGKLISRTVADRWDYGRGARQRFNQRELADYAVESPDFATTLAGLKFTDDLKSLSEQFISGTPSETPPKHFVIPEHLKDKLAVFYVDGNGFGKIGRDIMQRHGTDGFKEWSDKLRQHHRRLLKDLVSVADQDNAWKAGEEIRLETLLWGGDEILWVLPAWKGWDLARWFFSQTHEVAVLEEKHHLTYGCGLVFCHAKAPIKNIVALAKRLCDLAKETSRDGHRLAYEVLESYDDISGDLDDLKAHRRKFLPKASHVNDLVIDPTALKGLWDGAGKQRGCLKQIADSSDFPMRQLYMLTKAWRQYVEPEGGEDPHSKSKPWSVHESRLRDALSNPKVDIDKLLTAFGDPQGWLHLLQMLPYLPATAASGQGGGA